MEESVTSPQTQAIACPACNVSTAPDDAFCNACGYPFQGTEKEQQMFISNRSLRSMDLDEAHRKLKRASKALFFVAGLMAIAGFIYYAANQQQEARNVTLVINIILAGLFAALGFWAKTKPLAAIIPGYRFMRLSSSLTLLQIR